MRKWLGIVFVGALLAAFFSQTAHAKQDTLFNFDVTYVGQQENDDNDIDTEIQRTILSASGQAGFPLIEQKAYMMFGVDYKGQFIGYDNFDPRFGQNVAIRHSDLPEDLRLAVTARYWGEIPVREIARLEGITQPAVRKRIKRALKILGHAMEVAS